MEFSAFSTLNGFSVNKEGEPALKLVKWQIFINSYNSSNIENYCYLSEKYTEDWYFAPTRVSSKTENKHWL